MAEPATRPGVLRDNGILLHIGPHKTGTTAIQAALAAARPQLREAGITYPGHRMAHNRQASAALQRTLGWDHAKVDRAQWLHLAGRVRELDERVIVSSEVLCEADDATAARIVQDLGGSQRVQVVLTLRPLEALLPSNWQQYVKAGYRIGYGDWLTSVLESRDRPPATPSFWVRQHHPALIRRWAEVVGGPQNVVVVIADSARPRNLFDSFEDILRLPRNTLVPGEADPSNRSLSMAEVELLRQLNRKARHRFRYRDYHHFVKRGAVLNLVEGRVPGPDEPRVTTPRWAVERAREFSRSDVQEIGALGVTVLGDLAALAPQTPLPEADSVEQIDTVPIAVASAFLLSLLGAGVELRAAAEHTADEARDQAKRATRPRADTPGAKLDRALGIARRRLGALRRRLPGR